MTDRPPPVRFGVFELDVAAGGLRRNGEPVKLQEQPLQVLAALVEKPGEIVTKEELTERLWSGDTFVDFDRSLATAVNKVRQALGDSATRPRFVETVPKKGYRFVGGLHNGSPAVGVPGSAGTAAPETKRRDSRLILVLGALFAVIVAGLVVTRVGNGTSEPETLVATPLTADPGYEHWPSFSPDGEYLVFAAGDSRGTTSDIFTLHLDSRVRLRITNDTRPDYSPVWSPDGRSIGFLRDLGNGRFGVYVTSPLGGHERLLAEVAATFVLLYAELHPTLAWTHNSRYLVAADRSPGEEGYRLVRVAVETGQKHAIKGMGVNYAGNFDQGFSPDGTSILFKLSRAGDLQWGELIDGGSGVARIRNLTSGNSWISNPVFDAGGVIFSAGDKFSRRLWQVAMEGGPPRTLGALADSGYHPAISPAGDRLVYAQPNHDFNLWRLQLNDAREIVDREMVASSTRYDGNAAFSPDGESVVFESNRSGFSEVWFCKIASAECAPLTNFEAFSGTPAWSPDGTQIAFDSDVDGDWDVYVADLQGGPPRQVAGGASLDHAPAWSTDGNWIYFGSDAADAGSALFGSGFQVWRVPSSGGEAKQLSHAGGTLPQVSPDGRWVYYERPAAEPDRRSGITSRILLSILRQPAEGGDEEPVIPNAPVSRWAVTNEGIYFTTDLGDRVEVSFQAFESGEPQLVGVLDGPLYHRIDATPDGKTLLVTQIDRQGSDLMIVEGFR